MSARLSLEALKASSTHEGQQRVDDRQLRIIKEMMIGWIIKKMMMAVVS